jgi:hypothetical protein
MTIPTHEDYERAAREERDWDNRRKYMCEVHYKIVRWKIASREGEQNGHFELTDIASLDAFMQKQKVALLNGYGCTTTVETHVRYVPK